MTSAHHRIDLRGRFTGKIRCLHERLLAVPAGAWKYPHRLALEYALRDARAEISAGEVAERLLPLAETEGGPFNCLNFQLYLSTGDHAWLRQFVADATAPFRHPIRSLEGAWLHPRGRFGEGHAVLIDSFQEEAARAIKLAWLERRGDLRENEVEDLSAPHLEAEGAGQFPIHRGILRDEETGLWHNGRGWLAGRLSPGFWSRGHGWLLRGLSEAIHHLPSDETREVLIAQFQETVDALLRVRHPDHLWRAILTAGPAESPAESSGSAMIAAALLSAISEGYLPAVPYLNPAMETAETLLAEYLSDDGEIFSACYGPGPLVATTDYLAPREFPPNDPHGVAAFCMLAAAAAQLADGLP